MDFYQWYLNGIPLPNATNASLTIGRSLGSGSYILAIIVTKGTIVSSQSFDFSVGTPAATPSPGAHVYAATYGGGIAISADGGASFSNYTNGLGSNYCTGVYVSGSTIYAATYNGVSISHDGGNNFTNYTTANGLGSTCVYGVSVHGSTIYAATSNGNMLTFDPEPKYHGRSM